MGLSPSPKNYLCIACNEQAQLKRSDASTHNLMLASPTAEVMIDALQAQKFPPYPAVPSHPPKKTLQTEQI